MNEAMPKIEEDEEVISFLVCRPINNSQRQRLLLLLLDFIER